MYKVEDTESNEIFAIKLEIPQQNYPLSKEAKILMKLQHIPGVPKLHCYGQQDRLFYMGMQLLDNDLSYYMSKSNKKFNSRTVLNISSALTQILRKVHEAGVIHRDLKPENIMYKDPLLHSNQEFNTGNKSISNLYIIDFGISKFYVRRKEDINNDIVKEFMGTTRYASIASHIG